jgi:hypothetical protein
MRGPMPGLKWYAIFADQPQTTVEVAEPGDLLARFDIASQLGHLANRKIKGMWIIRREAENEDVLRIHGLVPAAISEHFHAAQRRRQR